MSVKTISAIGARQRFCCTHHALTPRDKLNRHLVTILPLSLMGSRLRGNARDPFHTHEIPSISASASTSSTVFHSGLSDLYSSMVILRQIPFGFLASFQKLKSIRFPFSSKPFELAKANRSLDSSTSKMR